MNFTYFPRKYSNNAILAFIIAIFLCYSLFWGKGLPIMWVAFAAIEFFGFFLYINRFSINWNQITSKSFTHKIFIYSFAIRLIWVIFSYFFFQYQTGQPFMFGAADSLFYHEAASRFSSSGGIINSILSGVGLSDLGFPIYLSLIYSLFGDVVIIPRLINALLGAWTVILIYKLAYRNFGGQVGRIAAIMTMLMPNLIYYCGIHLKETLMVFLLVAFMERTDMLMRGRIIWLRLFLILFLGGLLYFFRSALMASAMFALFSMLFFVRRPGSNALNRIFIGVWVLVIFLVTFSGRINAEFNAFMDYADSQQRTMQHLSEKERGNSLAKYGSALIFAPVVLIAPFPTFVNIDHQKVQMMLSGGYFVKNTLAFFVILSLIAFIRKRQLRKYILILSFMLAYLAILTQSTFALSERFHLPVLPFFLILAAYGVTQLNKKNTKYFIPYLILLIVMVIGWNWFKLAGRGII